MLTFKAKIVIVVFDLSETFYDIGEIFKIKGRAFSKDRGNFFKITVGLFKLLI